MTDVPACAHTKVKINSEDDTVTCRDCDSVWYPSFVIAAHVNEEVEAWLLEQMMA